MDYLSLHYHYLDLARKARRRARNFTKFGNVAYARSYYRVASLHAKEARRYYCAHKKGGWW